MYSRPVDTDDLPAGIVAHVKLDPPEPRPRDSARQVRLPLPGIVGSGPPWLNACEEVERAYRSGEWLAVEGEPGVGKLAVLTAVQLRRQPVGRLVVMDALDDAGDPKWMSSVRRAAAGPGAAPARHRRGRRGHDVRPGPGVRGDARLRARGRG